MPHLKCNGINVYYEIHGEGVPVLFLNGLSSDISKKMPIINAMKKYFKVVVPDIRGSGRSDKPKESYSISQFAEDVAELIEQLSFPKIDVMGFSMGGFITIDLALHFPELIDKIILVSTKPAWTKPEKPSDEAERIFHSTDISEKLLTDVFNLIYGPAYRKRFSAQSYVKERLSDDDPQPLHAYLNQLYACENFDLYEQINKINKPTLGACRRNIRFV